MTKSLVNTSGLSLLFTVIFLCGFDSLAQETLTAEQIDILSICEQQLEEAGQRKNVKITEVYWIPSHSVSHGFGLKADIIYEGTYKPRCLLPVGSDGKAVGECPPEEKQFCKTEVSCFPFAGKEPKVYPQPSKRCGPAKMKYQ